jgi:mannose-6-phosphate isomerase
MKLNAEVAILEPFRLEPMFVERIWGPASLRPWYDFVAPSGGHPVGEVWLTGDDCRVATGAMAGKRLGEVFAGYSQAMLGTALPESMQGASPLLIKVIFAKEKLSVQVHPDDRMAQKYGEPRGKTECWYVLAADPGAEVALGLRPGVTLTQVEAEVADGTLESSLQTVPVTPGDLVYVDAGTVHAVWPGSVLLETQQYSDTTYRLFDYGRPRELHVAMALEAIRMETAAGKVAPVQLADRTVRVDQRYFCVETIAVDGVREGASMTGKDEPARGLAYLFAAAGSARLTSVGTDGFDAVDLPSRGMVAVPASSPAWQIEDLDGLELIRITPRWSTEGQPGRGKPAAA